MRAILLGVLVGWMGLGAALQCSTFTPKPGETVTLTVVGAPVGASFRWDLDGDGRFETSSLEPYITLTAAAGARLVQVEVESAGQAELLAARIVANPYLGAVRTLIPEGTTFLVQVAVQSKVLVIAPGFVEEIPQGFALEVVAEGGAFWRRAEKLEVLWPLILEPGMTLVFTYRLFPPAGRTFQLSGLVSGYVEGQRVEVPIAGFFQP